jgi:hypothetical protein
MWALLFVGMSYRRRVIRIHQKQMKIFVTYEGAIRWQQSSMLLCVLQLFGVYYFPDHFRAKITPVSHASTACSVRHFH